MNYLNGTRTRHAIEARWKLNQVKFIYIRRYYKSQICFKGIYSLYSTDTMDADKERLPQKSSLTGIKMKVKEEQQRWDQTGHTHTSSWM